MSPSYAAAALFAPESALDAPIIHFSFGTISSGSNDAFSLITALELDAPFPLPDWVSPFFSSVGFVSPAVKVTFFTPTALRDLFSFKSAISAQVPKPA